MRHKTLPCRVQHEGEAERLVPISNTHSTLLIHMLAHARTAGGARRAGVHRG